MNRIETDLIKKLITGEVSRDQFIEKYPVDFKKKTSYVIDGLAKAYLDRNSDELDDFISLISFDENWRQNLRYSDIFCQLLPESWHYRHEDLVSLLQGLKNPDTVDCIYETALSKFAYMDYDESYSLARKCIHALADIHSDRAIEKLTLLAESSIPIVKDKAIKELRDFKNLDNRLL